MRLTVWTQPAEYKYTTNLVSKATVFHIFISLLTIIPPLFMAYRSQGFWMRTASYEEQPEVHFKHEVMVLLDLAKGGQVGWATFPTVNELLVDQVRVPVVKSREEDQNRDGLLDQLSISISVPLRPDEKVVGINGLLFFDIKLHKFSSVWLTGLAHLTGSGYPGSRLDLSGDLNLVQREPLTHRGRDTRYSSSPLDPSSPLPEDYQLASLLDRYSRRNLTSRLENTYTVWSPGSSPSAFTLKARLTYPTQTLSYRPGLWQVLKWGWVQYLSLLVIFMYLGSFVKTFVFSQQVLPTLTTQPWKQ